MCEAAASPPSPLKYMSLESMHFLSDESGLNAQSAYLSVGGNAAIRTARDVGNCLLVAVVVVAAAEIKFTSPSRDESGRKHCLHQAKRREQRV